MLLGGSGGLQNIMNFIRKIVFYGGSLIDLLKIVIVLVIILVLTNTFIGTIFVVSGESMYPTFKDGEFVWSNKVGYLVGEPSRYDSVVVLYPGDPTNKKYIKRVIGLPGEKVEIKAGRVNIYKNNQPISYNENFMPGNIVTEPEGVFQLKDNEYFLMGDNRPNSNDSRFFGAVERRFIFGHATLIFWPAFKSIN